MLQQNPLVLNLNRVCRVTETDPYNGCKTAVCLVVCSLSVIWNTLSVTANKSCIKAVYHKVVFILQGPPSEWHCIANSKTVTSKALSSEEVRCTEGLCTQTHRKITPQSTEKNLAVELVSMCHRKEVDSITGIFTRAEKTRAASICNKSAITDHVCNETHVIDWANAKVIDREADKAGRLKREAIWIRRPTTWIETRGATSWATYGTSFYILTTGTRSQSWWRLPMWSRNVDKQYVIFGCIRVINIELVSRSQPNITNNTQRTHSSSPIYSCTNCDTEHLSLQNETRQL